MKGQPMTDTPEPLSREFQSRTDAHTAENLEKTRKVLKRAQGVNWIIRKESRGDHKWPCFAVHDVEWLFGFIDAKDAEIARLVKEADYRETHCRLHPDGSSTGTGDGGWQCDQCAGNDQYRAKFFDASAALAAAEEKVAALEAELARLSADGQRPGDPV
jgi:hypothetical protein